jgi:hypothetical protein
MAPRVRDEQRQRIVELRLAHVPVRTVAAEVGVANATVVEVYRAWLANDAPSASTTISERTAEAIARLDQVAADARRGALIARNDGDHAACARYLSVEARTLASIAALEERMQVPGRAASSHEESPLDEIAAQRERRLAAADAAAPARRGS